MIIQDLEKEIVILSMQRNRTNLNRNEEPSPVQVGAPGPMSVATLVTLSDRDSSAREPEIFKLSELSLLRAGPSAACAAKFGTGLEPRPHGPRVRLEARLG